MINARFDLVTKPGNKDADKTSFARYRLDQAPGRMESVNILNRPYVVIERGWGYDEDELAEAIHAQEFKPVTTYLFVRILPRETALELGLI